MLRYQQRAHKYCGKVEVLILSFVNMKKILNFRSVIMNNVHVTI